MPALRTEQVQYLTLLVCAGYPNKDYTLSISKSLHVNHFIIPTKIYALIWTETGRGTGHYEQKQHIQRKQHIPTKMAN